MFADIWYAYGPVDELRQTLDVLKHCCDTLGRGFQDIELAAYYMPTPIPGREKPLDAYLAAGFTHLICATQGPNWDLSEVPEGLRWQYSRSATKETHMHVPNETDATRTTVEAMYDAGMRLDLEGFLSVFAPNAEVHEPTCLPYGGTYRGMPEIQTLFASVNQYLDLTSITVDHIVVESAYAVATVRIKVRATGNELLVTEHHTVTGDRIADLRIFIFDPTLVVN